MSSFHQAPGPLAAILGTTILLGLPSLSVPVSAQGSAGEASSDGIVVSTPVLPDRWVTPTYPLRAVEQDREGWVVLEMTVLEDGRPVDVRVVESSGGDDFAEAALSVMPKWRFQPKRVDGKPVAVTGHRIRMPFQLASGPGPVADLEAFSATMTEVAAAFQADDLDRVERLLNDLRARPRPFDAFSASVLASRYAQLHQRRGEPELALAALKSSLRNPKVLDPSYSEAILPEWFRLAVELNRPADALAARDLWLETQGDKPMPDGMAAQAAAIAAMVKGDSPLEATGTVNDTCTTDSDCSKDASLRVWRHLPVRQGIEVVAATGAISRLSGHCGSFEKRNQLEFEGPARVGLRFTLPGPALTCVVTFQGDPGSTVTLREFHPTAAD